MMKRILLVIIALTLSASPAFAAQKKPTVMGVNGQPQNLQSGDTVVVNASTTAAASINIPAGTAPTAPVDGDLWTTTGGIYARVNGATVGPLFGTNATGFFRSEQYVGAYTAQTTAYGGRILVTSPATDNAIVGAVVQDGSNGNSFPTGVTGYGLMVNAGNQAFGIFGQGDLGTNGGTAVAGTALGAEFNCFNYSGAPSASLPPDLSFGTAQKNCIAAQIADYGNYPGSIGLNIGYGTQSMLTGIYIHPQAATSYGIFVDATSTNSANYGAVIKTKTSATPLQIQTLGVIANQNAVLIIADNGGTARASIKQIGDYFGRAFVSLGLSVPTITTCSGVGTGGTCSLQAGSGDGAGTILLTAGTSAPAAGGTVALTFSSALGTNGVACVLSPAVNFLANTSLLITSQSTASFTFNYLNGGGTGTALTSASTYQVNYICAGR